MKIVVAIDSFKGSLTSLEAGEAAKAGILKAIPDAEVMVHPLADGGEGTVEALTFGLNGMLQKVTVTGPLGMPVNGYYGILENGTAVIEMAQAAGITLVPETQRNPFYTTTYGVGEMIRDAVLKGCRRFIIGIGGSATNDGGIGMLQALGFEFLDETGKPVQYGAIGLKELAAIRDDQAMAELKECEFRVACDVTNVLCGENGCSAVYGPQKGADSEMIRQMDQWLFSYAALVRQVKPAADAAYPGTGAAGGLGFAFLSFLNARLESGVKIILEETGLEKLLGDADLVITGEGCLDGQTAMGKAPVGAARLAKKYGKPVIAFAGKVTPEAGACHEAGIDAFFSIQQGAISLEEAMKPEVAGRNLTATVEQVVRVWKIYG